MATTIEETLLSQLSKFVADHLGLHFPKERWPDLERAVLAANHEHGHHDVDRYIQGLLSPTSTRHDIEILAAHLTVGETYFFREKRSLEILEQQIIPDLIRTSRPAVRQLRIWSAGCATGEEAYSIAILLSKMIPDLKDWSITILATDVNTRSLEKASAGVYGEWSFRGIPQWVKSRYFKVTADGRWAIVPALKEMVTFACLNLMEDEFPSLLNSTNSMDVIFCRNVLMYFTPEAMKRVVHHFHRSLANDGWLIVSPTETLHPLFSEFTTANFTGATLYRKTSGSLGRAPIPSPGAWNEMIPIAPPPRVMIECQESAEVAAQQIDLKSGDSAKRPGGPDRLAISHAEAFALYEQGRYEEAEEIIISLLSQNQNDELAMLLLARLYANQGRLAEAIQWCEKAIAMNKMDARAHYLRAAILQEQDSLEEAALSLRQALYADPQLVLGHFALGNLALKQGKLKESGKHFENALALLAEHRQEDILAESEGLTAGRLKDLIQTREIKLQAL